MTSRGRWVLGIVIAIVAINLVLAGLDRLTRGPTGPSSSSYATSAGGLAAYADLLARRGHPVRRARERLDRARLDPRGTVVLAEPQDVSPGEARALRGFLRDGGRVVAADDPPGAWLRFLLGDRAPRWQDVGRSHPLGVLAPAPETSGVRRVRADAGGWDRPRGLLPLVGDRRSPLAVAASVGRGRLILLADPAPLQNRLLGAVDNAALGVALAGARGRPVTFDEAAHGYGQSTGLAALPARWRWMLIGLLVAALLWLLAHARRLGPVEDEALALPPPRRAYLEALAGALARTKRRDEATAAIPAAVRRRLRLREDAGAEDLVAAGLADDEVAALLGRADGQDAVLARGRALARVQRGGR